MADTLATIELAIQQSEQLLTLAERESWPEFEQLEASRQETIAEIQLQTLDLEPNQHSHLQSKLMELIRLNQNLETVCRDQRQLVVTELQKFNQGNQAKKAYSE